ncbi:MAG: hypothetical protein JSV56_08240 [Methanomassiliicoccales archaeon]|nr:MAG: hypothetical protein JSV56_08240 [Methanomassiliicoccales archaeon]
MRRLLSFLIIFGLILNGWDFSQTEDDDAVISEFSKVRADLKWKGFHLSFGDVVLEFPCPPGVEEPEGLAFGQGYLWFASQTQGIYQLNPSDGSVVFWIPMPMGCVEIHGLAHDGNYLWAAAYDDNLYQIDPSDGSVISLIPAPGEDHIEGLAWNNTYLWLSRDDRKIYKIDPSSGAAIDIITAGSFDPEGLAYGDGFLWEGGFDNKISQIDPQTGTIIRSFSGPGYDIGGLAWDGAYLWADSQIDKMIYKINVLSPPEKIKAAVLRSSGSLMPFYWENLNSNWSLLGPTGVVIDYTSLYKLGISYADIVATQAQVLIIDDARSPTTLFSPDEVDAIIQYVEEGHGLIVTGGTFRSEENWPFISLLGFSQDACGQVSFEAAQQDTIDIVEPSHPLFKHLPEYITASKKFYSGSDWDGDGYDGYPGDWETVLIDPDAQIVGYVWNLNHLSGEQESGPISCIEKSEYRAAFAGFTPANYSPTIKDYRFFYNMIVWTGEYPVPDIKANGSDGPITITSSDTLSITVELYSGINAGIEADWWLVANTPLGWYYYDKSAGWLPGREVTLQIPLRDLPSREVLNMTGLPAGLYTFYFGVDLVKNGKINLGQAYYDTVEVTINP